MSFMVKRFILLSILSITFISAEEFAFVCDDVNSSSDIPQSLTINTKNKYVIFMKNKYEIYVNEENYVMAKYEYSSPFNGKNLLELDKVSGWLEYFSFNENKNFDTDGVYKCESTERLMD